MEDMITMGREFLPQSELSWHQAPGLTEGAMEAIIYKDEASKTYARLLRLPSFLADIEPADKPIFLHDFNETVYIISGGIINTRTGFRYEAGSVAYFPKGMKHGPLSAPCGALMLEVRHYV